AERAHHVAEAAAITVQGTIICGARADGRERVGWRDPGRAQVELALLGRRRNLQRTESEALSHPLRHVPLLLEVGSLVLVAPSPEFASALGHSFRTPISTVEILAGRSGERKSRPGRGILGLCDRPGGRISRLTTHAEVYP